MTKHFAMAFIALSTFFAGTCGSASARGIAGPEIPTKSTGWTGETGTASYYGPAYHGRRSASGLRFNQEALTAAHPWLPFGTRVKVSLPETGRTVIVTITDRLYSNRRIVDLSVAAARRLGMIKRGIAEVTLLPA